MPSGWLVRRLSHFLHFGPVYNISKELLKDERKARTQQMRPLVDRYEETKLFTEVVLS